MIIVLFCYKFEIATFPNLNIEFHWAGWPVHWLLADSLRENVPFKMQPLWSWQAPVGLPEIVIYCNTGVVCNVSSVAFTRFMPWNEFSSVFFQVSFTEYHFYSSVRALSLIARLRSCIVTHVIYSMLHCSNIMWLTVVLSVDKSVREYYNKPKFVYKWTEGYRDCKRELDTVLRSATFILIPTIVVFMKIVAQQNRSKTQNSNRQALKAKLVN